MDLKVSKNTAVVFDLDDTLYNELEYLKSAYRAIAQTLDPKKWEMLYSKMFSLYRSQHNVFEFLSECYAIETTELLDRYRNHIPDIQLFDGVLEVFKAIKKNQGKIGIITDGRSLTQRVKLERLGIYNDIDKIVISEEIGTEKPCLANFKALESALPHCSYCYIADNLKKDFIVPNVLGWKTIALVDNGKNIHYESHQCMEAKYQPDHYIIDFKQLTVV